MEPKPDWDAEGHHPKQRMFLLCKLTPLSNQTLDLTWSDSWLVNMTGGPVGGPLSPASQTGHLIACALAQSQIMRHASFNSTVLQYL